MIHKTTAFILQNVIKMSTDIEVVKAELTIFKEQLDHMSSPANTNTEVSPDNLVPQVQETPVVEEEEVFLQCLSDSNPDHNMSESSVDIYVPYEQATSSNFSLN